MRFIATNLRGTARGPVRASAKTRPVSTKSDAVSSTGEAPQTEIYSAKGGKLPRYLLHGCCQPPAVVFQRGLQADYPSPALVNADDDTMRVAIEDHAWGIEDGPQIAWRQNREFVPDAFVATSKDPKIAAQFAVSPSNMRRFDGTPEPHVYVIDARGLEQVGIRLEDVNKRLGNASPHAVEHEVGALNEVPSHYIKAAIPVEGGALDGSVVLGTPLLNPDFKSL